MIQKEMILVFVFILVDYCLGVFSSIIKTNKKGEKLSSKTALTGITKKIGEMILLVIGAALDWALEINYVETFICFSLVATELISIIENLTNLGVPIPKVLGNIIDLVKKRCGEDESETEGN